VRRISTEPIGKLFGDGLVLFSISADIDNGPELGVTTQHVEGLGRVIPGGGIHYPSDRVELDARTDATEYGGPEFTAFFPCFSICALIAARAWTFSCCDRLWW